MTSTLPGDSEEGASGAGQQAASNNKDNSQKTNAGHEMEQKLADKAVHSSETSSESEATSIIDSYSIVGSQSASSSALQQSPSANSHSGSSPSVYFPGNGVLQESSPGSVAESRGGAHQSSGNIRSCNARMPTKTNPIPVPDSITGIQDLDDALRLTSSPIDHLSPVSLSLGRQPSSSALMNSIQPPVNTSHSYNPGYTSMGPGGAATSQENMSSVCLAASTGNAFPLMDNEEHLFFDDEKLFLHQLGMRRASDTQLRVVCMVGNPGEGKSHALNKIFFKDREVFRTVNNNDEIEGSFFDSMTSYNRSGIDAAYMQDHNLLVLDTEGKTSTSVRNINTNRIIFKAMAASDVIIYRCRSERLQPDLYEFLSGFIVAYDKFLKPAMDELVPADGKEHTRQRPILYILHDTRGTMVLTDNEKGSAVSKIKDAAKQYGFPLDGYGSINYIGCKGSSGQAPNQLRMHMDDSMKIEPAHGGILYGGGGGAGSLSAGQQIQQQHQVNTLLANHFADCDLSDLTDPAVARAASGAPLLHPDDESQLRSSFVKLRDDILNKLSLTDRSRSAASLLQVLKFLNLAFKEKVTRTNLPFPDYFFTCQECCLVCNEQCNKSMLHACYDLVLKRSQLQQTALSHDQPNINNNSINSAVNVNNRRNSSSSNTSSSELCRRQARASSTHQQSFEADTTAAASIGHTLAHQSKAECKFSNKLQNKRYLCVKCLKQGHTRFVIHKPYDSKEGFFKGMVNYAFNGAVLECPSCGPIFSSRSSMVYSCDPENSQDVLVENIHVWNSEPHVGYSTSAHSARQALEGISYMTAPLSNLTANLPTASITSWINDTLVNPPHWKKNCTHCDLCQASLVSGVHHCRQCGLGFCDRCSSRTMKVGAHTHPVRVCDTCYDAPPSIVSAPDEPMIATRQVSEMCRSFLQAATSTATGLLVSSTSPEYWVPNEEITECCVCKSNFEQAKLRLHHCRACGQGVCDGCSPSRLPVVERNWTHPVRVCDNCVDSRKHVTYQEAA